MNYLNILAEIEKIKARIGRKDPIKLVAVTKNRTIEELKQLYELGCRLMGENRFQDSLPKIESLPKDIQWHFIGTLQKNKAAKVINYFQLIESVDSLDLAVKIDSLAPRKFPIFLQVNTSLESSKHGLRPEEWEKKLEYLLTLPNLEMRGLMTMAPLTEDQQLIRQTFARLRVFRDQIEKKFQLSDLELSMGMSHDYPIAIEEGATILRIGTALFIP